MNALDHIDLLAAAAPPGIGACILLSKTTITKKG
jgi:hypothetical protein